MPRRATKEPVGHTASATVQYLRERYIGDDPDQQAVYEEHLVNAEIARKVYDLRTKAGLSQRALARQVGTTASVICQLEDVDYRGHSLSMLKRIAAALDQRIEIRFIPTHPPTKKHESAERPTAQRAGRIKRKRPKVAANERVGRDHSSGYRQRSKAR